MEQWAQQTEYENREELLSMIEALNRRGKGTLVNDLMDLVRKKRWDSRKVDGFLCALIDEGALIEPLVGVLVIP